MDKVILQKWLKAGYLEKADLFPTERGTPHGGIISPCLANLVLDGMEAILDKEFGSGSNISNRVKYHASLLFKLNGVKLCRYADDFVVTGTSKELLERKVRPVIENFLKERGLELSQEKTIVTHTTEGFDFLGQKCSPICTPSLNTAKTFPKESVCVEVASPTININCIPRIIQCIVIRRQRNVITRDQHTKITLFNIIDTFLRCQSP